MDAPTITYTVSEADWLAFKECAAVLSACASYLPERVQHNAHKYANAALQVTAKPTVHFDKEIAA